MTSGFSGLLHDSPGMDSGGEPSCLQKGSSELPPLCCFIEQCKVKSKNCVFPQTLSRFPGPQIPLPSMAVQVLLKKNQAKRSGQHQISLVHVPYLFILRFSISPSPGGNPFHGETGKCYTFASIYKVHIKLFVKQSSLQGIHWHRLSYVAVPGQGSKQGMYV